MRCKDGVEKVEKRQKLRSVDSAGSGVTSLSTKVVPLEMPSYFKARYTVGDVCCGALIPDVRNNAVHGALRRKPRQFNCAQPY